MCPKRAYFCAFQEFRVSSSSFPAPPPILHLSHIRRTNIPKLIVLSSLFQSTHNGRPVAGGRPNSCEQWKLLAQGSSIAFACRDSGIDCWHRQLKGSCIESVVQHVIRAPRRTTANNAMTFIGLRVRWGMMQP